MPAGIYETVLCCHTHAALHHLTLGAAVINNNRGLGNLMAVILQPLACGAGCDSYMYKVTLLYVLAVQYAAERALQLRKTAYRLIQVKTKYGPAGLMIYLGQRSAYQAQSYNTSRVHIRLSA